MSRESAKYRLWGIVFGPTWFRRRWQKRESTVEILRFMEASWVFSYTCHSIICILLTSNTRDLQRQRWPVNKWDYQTFAIKLKVGLPCWAPARGLERRQRAAATSKQLLLWGITSLEAQSKATFRLCRLCIISGIPYILFFRSRVKGQPIPQHTCMLSSICTSKHFT